MNVSVATTTTENQLPPCKRNFTSAAFSLFLRGFKGASVNKTGC